MSNESFCAEDEASTMNNNKDLPHIVMTHESDDASDVFGHSDCGEPLLEQHIVLDFTPNEEDTDYIQGKCCAFWEFVNSQPELQTLVTALEVDKASQVSESGDYASICDQPGSSMDYRNKEKTAVSMLELVEEKGLIDRAFESRLPTSHCSLGFMDYLDETSFDNAEGENLYEKPLKHRKQQDKQNPPPSSQTVRALCKQLQAWDLEHPKSMEPPGPSPNLQYVSIEKEALKNKECTCMNSSCRYRRT